MKQHDYLNLKIGSIEQYAMVVKKKDLETWRKSGWLPFTEIGLPEGDEEAWMLYGDIKKSETLIFNRPSLVRDTPVESLIGLEIKEICTCLGTYGMGGPGFFGLLLSNGYYLTYAVSHASEYILVQDRVVMCDQEYYQKGRPWISELGGAHDWDELSPLLVGSKVEQLFFTHDACDISLTSPHGSIDVRFVKNDALLPKKGARKANAFKKGVISDLVLLQHQNGRLIV